MSRWNVFCNENAPKFFRIAMKPSFSTMTTDLFSWQNTVTDRFFLLERIVPCGSANSWSNLIDIFPAHLWMGGIFLLAKVCEPPRMVFVR